MNKKIVMVIICILIIIVAIIAGVSATKEENVTNNSVENTTIEKNEAKEENIVVEENEVEVENVVKEPEKTDYEPNTGTSVVPSSSVYETNSDLATTDKTEQAIKLAQEHWGEDSTVTFRCDEVTANGEYLIAVISKQTASVKNYFRVNLQNKTVEVEY